MNKLQKYSLVILVILPLGCKKNGKSNGPEIQPKSDTLISLENERVKLTYSLLGGALIEFQDKKSLVNPFTWKMDAEDMPENNKNGAVFQGHFLCSGRWGSPSSGESKLGMPDNGESSNNWWKPEGNNTALKLKMSCEALLDGFSINRSVILSQKYPLIKVIETFTNDLSICRTNTILQHATVGPPFFDKNLIVNTNATFGFNHSFLSKGVTKYEYLWPNAITDTLKISPIDLRRSQKVQFISSHIFKDSIGWVTASNPNLNLMLGYAWKSMDYPWFNLWNGLQKDNYWAKGLLFGTTGLGDKSSCEERLTETFHGFKNFEVIDAKESRSKYYYCFLISIPENYEQTLNVIFENDLINIKIKTSYGIKEYKLTL
jgi:hypothetical protein